MAVHYKEYQLVRSGDPLIDIDSRPYRASLLQAQGTLARDQSLLAQALMDLERYHSAYIRNAIAEQIFADQEKLVQQYRGSVKSDIGTVNYDELQVQYCHIVSPISGRVGLRLVDPGNVVRSNGDTALAVITQLQPITVVFSVPEASLGPVEARLRDKAKLTVEVFDRTAQKRLGIGELVALDNQINTTTGTVRARAVVDNNDGALFPNQFVSTRLLVDTLRGVTLIPEFDIQHNGQASFVYVILNNVAHMRTIGTGVTNAGVTQVENVSPGEVIANSTFENLQENTRVIISSKPIATTTSLPNAP